MDEIGVTVSLVSPVTGDENRMVLPTTAAKVLEYLDNRAACPLVQDMFPELDDGQREFLLSGLPPWEWDRLYPKENDHEQ